MILPIDESQERLLHRSQIRPVFLVDLTSASGTLRFSTHQAIDYLGNRYQPYLSSAGVLRTAASFPENNTSSKELQLQFDNDSAIELNGTPYDHLSQTFYPVFPWELADVRVRLLLTDGETRTFTEDVALDWVAGGIAGAPTNIDRQKFLLPVYTRNYKLNDQIPLRPVAQEDFPEADRDELNGSTYLPIVVGSGVRVRALATAAGATTTITEEVSAGTTLKVSETTGFEAGDEIILNGFVQDPLTIGAVDPVTNQLTGLSPDLSTLGQTLSLGTIVRENKTEYDYTVADHECGEIHEVRVTPRGETEPVVISGSLYSKVTVEDPSAIGGKRTDVRITERIPFGSDAPGGVTKQPEFSVDQGIHKHNVGVTQTSIATSFAGSTSPAGGSSANDGNTDTFYGLSADGQTTLTYQSFSSVPGDHILQRYYMVAAGPTVDGDVRIRRGAVAYLTLSAAFGKGEFRSSPDSGGSDNTTWNVVVQTSPTTCNLYEGWKEIESDPSVDEDFQDLRDTTRDTDVSVDVSGADIEIGEEVEVVIDGVPVPDDSGRYGDVTASGTAIQRPDGVARWFLEQVLGQTEEVIDLVTYSGSAAHYAAQDFRLSFALQEPIKLDALLDQIANNSQSLNYWGRSGHALRYLDTPTVTGTFTEDQAGVISVDWRNAHHAADIRNSLTAYYGRDWTRRSNRDEAYAGNVLLQNSDSQARFGVRGNEVVGSTKAFQLDFTPTESQAEAILSKILADKANPLKEFTTVTDWTYINVEPGDDFLHNSPTLAAPTVARVIENTVDPRLFCRIVAKEIGSASAEAVRAGNDLTDLESVFFDQLEEGNGVAGLADYTGRSGSWDDAWTIFLRHKFNALPNENSPSRDFDFITIREHSNTRNNIHVRWRGDSTHGGTCDVRISSKDGAFQTNTFNGLWTLAGVQGEWLETIITWDNSDVKVFSGPTGTFSSLSVADSVTGSDPNMDTTGTRDIFFLIGWASDTNDMEITFHNFALWPRVLSAAELTFLSQNKTHDLKVAQGDYLGSPELYFRFRSQGDVFGENLGTGSDFDLSTDGSLDASDQVSDTP